MSYDESTGPVGAPIMVTDLNAGSDFLRQTDELVDELPANAGHVDLTRGVTSDDQLRQQLDTALLAGSGLVSYVGHGSVDHWRGDLLDSDAALALQNGDKLPFFTMANCLNAYFQDPFLTSLGEALLLAPDGGAVAVWASSGITYAGAQSVLMKEFYHQLLHEHPGSGTIGEAAVAAKRAIDGDVRTTFLLLGDPAMHFRPLQ